MQKNILLSTLAVLALSVGSAVAETYTFKVTNKTEVKITEILVSENGKEYAPFDIGAGIGAGKTVTLAWDESTNDQNCKQFVKAIWSNGDESVPTKFDFCEEDLEIEFTE